MGIRVRIREGINDPQNCKRGYNGLYQCCGSRSGSTRILIRFGRLHPDLHWEYGSGFRRAKMNDPQKWRKFKFWCSLLRDEDFACSCDVLYGGLGRDKYNAIFDQGNINFFSAVIFPQFFVIKTLDLNPDRIRIALTKSAGSGSNTTLIYVLYSILILYSG